MSKAVTLNHHSWRRTFEERTRKRRRYCSRVIANRREFRECKRSLTLIVTARAGAHSARKKGAR